MADHDDSIDKPRGNPRAVLHGELVFDPNQDARSERAKKWAYTASLDDDTVAEIIRERVVKKRTLRSLEEQYGVSRTTIQQWSGESLKAKANDRDTARVRAQIAMGLETVALEAWKMFRESDHPMVKNNALIRIESAYRSIAQLRGANEPIRAEVTVTEDSAVDREFREMVTEAQARAAVRKAQIEREFRARAGGES
jgi:hypothetical protein